MYVLILFIIKRLKIVNKTWSNQWHLNMWVKLFLNINYICVSIFAGYQSITAATFTCVLRTRNPRRHPALLSRLPACVEHSIRSDRLEILLNKWHQIFSRASNKRKSSYFLPPRPPFHWAGWEPTRSPVPSSALRRTADARRLALLSANTALLLR